ncbi:hypothetical protein ACFL2P_01110 [Candidatus Moduliflexota bacterium]
MKKLLIGVAVFTAVVIVAAIVLVGNVEKIVKGALESVGSELMGTRVRVAKVDLDLKSGSGRISGFTVANPEGYSSEKAFRMDTISLDLKLSSLGKQPLVVEELQIRDPVVRLEAREDGSSNLQTLLDNIRKNSDSADRKAAEGQPKPDDASQGEPVRISFGVIAASGVKVEASIPGREPQGAVLPDIVMRDVGRGKGLTPAEIGRVVIGKIFTESLEAILKKKMTEKVEETAKGFLGDLKSKVMPEKDK